MSETRQTLTTGEIARYCGVNFRTVIRWIKRGHLKAYQLPGRGDNRVLVAEFLRFLAANHMPVPTELSSGGPQRVLIVDDDGPSARSIQRLLHQAGFETQIAEDGFRAGVLLEELNPAVMTLDLSMPGLPGTDVVRFVRSRPNLAATRILIVSGMPQEDLAAAVSLGADDYLQKPFDSAQLVAKVSALAGAADA